MGREENVKVFRDTEKQVKEKKTLADAVRYSTGHQILVPEYMAVAEMMPEVEGNLNRYSEDAQIVVSGKRSYEAASAYKEMQVCVHNFASATNPGGGVTRGSSAQEECLCRCSTLYFNLNTSAVWAGFYTPHRNAGDPLHNDDCIYTPEVVVFKTDTANPELMHERDWYKVNVVTCAAPNLRSVPGNAMNVGDGSQRAVISEEELCELQEKRLSRILEVVAAGGNDVVILGAFGCGAFENPPEVVAKASKKVIERYKRSFKIIEFAIYCSPRDEQNYTVFRKAFNM